jgi:putative addiction module component (TIGR02574 family)
MVSKIKDIEKKALKLPLHERALLARALLRSLDKEEEEDPKNEEKWIEEVERRYQNYLQNTPQLQTSEEVFKEIRSNLR